MNGSASGLHLHKFKIREVTGMYLEVFNGGHSQTMYLPIKNYKSFSKLDWPSFLLVPTCFVNDLPPVNQGVRTSALETRGHRFFLE